MQPTEMVGMITFFCVCAFIAKAVLDTVRRTRAQKLQIEMFNKLLDKSAASKDMLDYLQTEAGQKLMEAAPADRAPAPHGRIFNSLQAGIVLLAVGIGCLVLTSHGNADVREGATIFSTILIALGLGLIAAGGASLWLSRSLGLMNGRHESR